VKTFWCLLFVLWPIIAITACVVAPSMNWWFPGEAASPLGQRIDDLFYLINVIVTLVFVGTQIALGYVLFKGAAKRDDDKAWFSHGSHKLEVIWTIVPGGILLFLAFYQMDVWGEFRIKGHFPKDVEAVAEVTARQFEWRIRYPAPGRPLMQDRQPDDLYTVNDLHVPTGRPVLINLRTADVQHAFFSPELRVKQDAVPGLIIPVWFEIPKRGEYTLTCAELCGWGHYKMKARIAAEPEAEFRQYLEQLQIEQNDDGFPDDAGEDEGD